MKILILIEDCGYLMEDGEFVQMFFDYSHPSRLQEIIQAGADRVIEASHIDAGWDLDQFHQDETPQEIWDELWAHATGDNADELTRREIRAAESGLSWFMTKLYNLLAEEEFDQKVQEIAERTRQWPRAQYTAW